jgi:tRNA modification GTPase
MNDLNNIVQIQDFGALIQGGIRCVIVGRPNVGKSSFFNALVGENKAIVSNIAGTTRDVLEVSLQLNGLQFIIQDTAGLHQTKDYIENLGIKKVSEKIKEADAIFWLLDSSESFSEEDFLVYKKINRNKNIYILLNKEDKKIKLRLPEFIKKWPHFFISVKNKTGLDNFKQALASYFRSNFDQIDLALICNIRQINCIKQTLKSLKNILNSVDNLFDDLLAIDLKQSILKLGELSGEDVNEEVLDGIFSRFCVGK